MPSASYGVSLLMILAGVLLIYGGLLGRTAVMAAAVIDPRGLVEVKA